MSKPLTTQGLVALLALFTGLCTMFALIVTISDGWQEHAQQSWPHAIATIEHCSVDPYIPLDRLESRAGLVYQMSYQLPCGWKFNRDQHSFAQHRLRLGRAPRPYAQVGG